MRVACVVVQYILLEKRGTVTSLCSWTILFFKKLGKITPRPYGETYGPFVDSENF